MSEAKDPVRERLLAVYRNDLEETDEGVGVLNVTVNALVAHIHDQIEAHVEQAPLMSTEYLRTFTETLRAVAVDREKWRAKARKLGEYAAGLRIKLKKESENCDRLAGELVDQEEESIRQRHRDECIGRYGR